MRAGTVRTVSAGPTDAEWFDGLAQDPHRLLHPDELERFFREAERREAVPVLRRISGVDDAAASSLLASLPEVIDPLSLRSLDEQAVGALARLGSRSPSLALRSGDASVLRSGLLAQAVSTAAKDFDDRDAMVGLAPFVDAAQRMGISASQLFEAVASRLDGHRVGDLYRTFGARKDVTLAAFGWDLVESPEGPDYVPVPWRRPPRPPRQEE